MQLNFRDCAFLGTGLALGSLVSYICTKKYYKDKIEKQNEAIQSIVNEHISELLNEPECDEVNTEDTLEENDISEANYNPEEIEEPYETSDDFSLYERLIEPYSHSDIEVEENDTYSNVLFLSSESYSEFFDGCEENVEMAQQRVTEANYKGIPASVEDIRNSEPYSVLDFDIFVPDRKDPHQNIYLFDNQLQEVVSVADSCSMFGCDISGLARMISDEEDEQLHIVNLTKRFMAEITLQKDSFYNHPKGKLLLQQIEDDDL